MNATDMVSQLERLGSDSYRKILINHGANEPVLGVKIADLKRLQKQTKTDHHLALELFDTGIYDAQYLAGLVVDDEQMSKRDLRHWVAKSNCPAISGTIVAWVAAESRVGNELALKWVDAKNENAAQTGWMTLCSLVAITDDAVLDLSELTKLLQRVGRTIHKERNLVRYAMNSFVIATGSYVTELIDLSLQIGEKIGTVSVDMGNTSCAVPSAVEYIQKVQRRGAIGKKRKTAKC
ncbi:MAG: DNA alkylation repair protein [Planctomycetes bacterium]|nr:DNA alkylation repair protein [Planctomycetota bacterium]MBL7038946.1 DNA alkylation repair protein [Pirellulaceae bacterium]